MRFLVVLLLALTLTEQSASAVDAETGGGPAAESPAQEAVRAAVAARVETRWAAIIRGDFAAAYALEAPGYRQTVSVEAFRSKFGQAAAWKDAKVAAVTLAPDGLAAKVRVDITYEPKLLMAGTFSAMTRPLMESWLLKDEQWWHVSE